MVRNVSHYHRPSAGLSSEMAAHFTVGMVGPTWFVEMADDQEELRLEHTRDFLRELEDVYAFFTCHFFIVTLLCECKKYRMLK